MADGGIKLAPLKTEIKVDIDNFKRDMSKASSIGVGEAQKISKQLSTTLKVGETLSKLGDKMTKGLTLPIVGAGTAVTKMAVDYESSFAKVSTLLDSNVVDLREYKDDILDASSETKVAVDEFSEAVYSSISAGVEQTKAIGFTTEAMKLAKGGFTDGAKAVDVLTTAINGYNLKADDASRISDLLITTQNLGKTTVDELASSMGAVIPVANSVGFGIEELSAAYAQLTKNGIATAESGTYMKAMLSELGKNGSVVDKALRELTGKGFAQLKAEGVPTTDILKMLNDVAEKDGKTLKDMFSSVEAGSAALVLYKGSGTEYNEMLAEMGNSAGATQEAFEKMDATPAEQLKGALNKLRNEGIKFGASFVPVIEKVADVVGTAAEKFSGLSEEQQNNTIKWGLILSATGPVLKVIGGGVSTFAKLSNVIGGASKAIGVAGSSSGLIGGMTGLLGACLPVAGTVAAVGAGLYTVCEYGDLMNSTVLKSTDEMSAMERILAVLTGTETYSREELENMGLVHKEFSEDISPDFQKAVEDSTEKLQDFSVFLREIGFDNVISKEESDEFTSRVDTTCSEVIETIKSKRDESQQSLRELFVADDQVIDEGEQKVLDILSESSNKQITEVTTLHDEILAIKQKAVDEGRALNEQEIADIEAKNEKIRQIELQALGGTEEEILYTKKEFAERVKVMDAESATELLQEKAKERNEEIIQIKASYDTEIELLKAKAAEATGENKRALEEQAANLEADKKAKIDSQYALWDEYMKIIKEKNPKIVDQINEYNGKILTNADRHSQDMLECMKESYDNIDQITETGYYQVYDKTRDMWTTIRVVVDEDTKEITGIYDELTGSVGGYTKEMGNAAKDMAAAHTDAYKEIEKSIQLYVDNAGNIIDENSKVITSLNELDETTDGVRYGIIEINNTKYSIKVDKDGTVSDLKEIGSTADEATKDRTIHVGVSFNDVTKFQMASLSPSGAGSFGSWNFNGIDNVPYDGYHAVLHKNERVLTAEENRVYSNQPQVDYGAIQKIMRNEIGSIVIEMNDRELGRAIRKVR